MDLDSSQQALLALLGDEFIAYVMATDAASARARIAGVIVPNFADAVFQDLIAAAGQVFSQRRTMTVNGRPALEPPTDAFSRLAQYQPEHRMGFASWLRQRAGGSLPDARRADKLLESILLMGRDWYPAILLPRDEGSPWGRMPWQHLRMTTINFQHPARDAFRAAISEQEEPLRKFWASHPVAEHAHSRRFWSSSGHGGALQVSLLSEFLLTTAEARLRLTGRELSIELFLDTLKGLLGELRALATGDTVMVPAAIGLSPLKSELDTALQTPWGSLQTPSDWHRAQMPASAELILHTTFPLTLEFQSGDADDFEPPPPGFFAAQEALSSQIEKVRLLLLLALRREQPVGVTVAWRVISDPTSLSGASFSQDHVVPTAETLRPEDEGPLEQWAGTIDAVYEPVLDLAVRRTLSSIVSRAEPADAIVDAVVALESLFGTGSSEVGFRISTAVAWLLETTEKGRLRRQDAVNKLYSLRSDIVHGKHVAPERLHEKRLEASQLATDSLRQLLDKYPRLVGAGNQRGKMLILQGFEAGASA